VIGIFKSIKYSDEKYTTDENADTISIFHLMVLNQYLIGILFSKIIILSWLFYITHNGWAMVSLWINMPGFSDVEISRIKYTKLWCGTKPQ